MNRPSEYKKTSINLDRVFELSRKGLNLGQIAGSLGVSRATLDRRREEFAEIDEKIAAGRADGIEEMASLLFEHAAAGDPQSVKFYLERRGQWLKTTNQNVELSGKGPTLNILLSPTSDLDKN